MKDAYFHFSIIFWPFCRHWTVSNQNRVPGHWTTRTPRKMLPLLCCYCPCRESLHYAFQIRLATIQQLSDTLHLLGVLRGGTETPGDEVAHLCRWPDSFTKVRELATCPESESMLRLTPWGAPPSSPKDGATQDGAEITPHFLTLGTQSDAHVGGVAHMGPLGVDLLDLVVVSSHWCLVWMAEHAFSICCLKAKIQQQMRSCCTLRLQYQPKAVTSPQPSSVITWRSFWNKQPEIKLYGIFSPCCFFTFHYSFLFLILFVSHFVSPAGPCGLALKANEM